MPDALLSLRDARLTSLEAVAEQVGSAAGGLVVAAQVTLEPLLFPLRLLELAAGGYDVDHPGTVSQRLREPGLDEGVELVGVDEGASGAGSVAAFLQ